MADDKAPAKEEPKQLKSVSLEDLNNDPTLLYTLTPAQAAKLYEKAEVDGGLPHNVLSTLHRIGLEDHTPASKEEQEAVAAAAAAGFGT